MLVKKLRFESLIVILQVSVMGSSHRRRFGPDRLTFCEHALPLATGFWFGLTILIRVWQKLVSPIRALVTLDLSGEPLIRILRYEWSWSPANNYAKVIGRYRKRSLRDGGKSKRSILIESDDNTLSPLIIVLERKIFPVMLRTRFLSHESRFQHRPGD